MDVGVKPGSTLGDLALKVNPSGFVPFLELEVTSSRSGLYKILSPSLHLGQGYNLHANVSVKPKKLIFEKFKPVRPFCVLGKDVTMDMVVALSH